MKDKPVLTVLTRENTAEKIHRKNELNEMIGLY